mmetsp:Transcript_28232/g.64585  ORF Transcript_28232/g.64585 Transcript_28232/m.64585 type:complete len:99 (+) Transcript_28232:2094-2390(+)
MNTRMSSKSILITQVMCAQIGGMKGINFIPSALGQQLIRSSILREENVNLLIFCFLSFPLLFHHMPYFLWMQYHDASCKLSNYELNHDQHEYKCTEQQ